MSHLMCLGLGYSARYLAGDLARLGWRITGTTRHAAGLSDIERLGYAAVVFDGETVTNEVRLALAEANHVLISAPPSADGDPILRVLAADLAAARPKWIGYLSTIGVYGDANGGWVDEETPPNPLAERSVRRLRAERQWLEFGEFHGLRVEIFRLAGIYGPGQSAVESVLAGTARRIVKPGQVFNRIHVVDIAQVVQAALAGPPRHAIYNVTDDEPAPPQDVVAFAAQCLRLPPPPEIAWEEAGLEGMAASFYAENKRVSNRRIKDALGISLTYPTYREGIAALAARAVQEGAGR